MVDESDNNNFPAEEPNEKRKKIIKTYKNEIKTSYFFSFPYRS